MEKSTRKLRAGDWVEVRTKEEILLTLDRSGQLDGLPFMPEMFSFCGKRFRVFKRAHKTCDTVFPVRGRRMDGAVHLDTRCDGQAHGGCQAACLIFWKEAWLKPVGNLAATASAAIVKAPMPAISTTVAGGATESDVRSGAQRAHSHAATPAYVCQATQLPYATSHLAWWDLRQYAEDFRSGNVGFGRVLSGFVYSMYYNLSQAGIGLGRPMRWLYDKLYPLWRGTPFPRKSGTIPEGQPTPSVSLDLQPGDWVRVKPHDDILRTVSTGNKNRGMFWDAELVPYCGGTYRVLKRVTLLIDEKTGTMLEMKNPGIILDSVVCQARYSNCRMFCPRSIYPYWREIWLEKVKPPLPGAGGD